MLKPNINSSFNPINTSPKPYKNTHFESHNNFKNYQSPANHYKENLSAQPISNKFSFEQTSNFKPSVNQSKECINKYEDSTLMNSRLQQIRKKYENKSRKPNDSYEGPKTPLKDSKISNGFYQKYSNPEYKKQSRNQYNNSFSQDTPTLMKSFSFLNHEKQTFKLENKQEEPFQRSFYNNREVKSIKSSSIKEQYENNQYKRPQVFDYPRIKEDLEYKRNQLISTSNTWNIEEQEKRFQPPVTKNTMNDFVKNTKNDIGRKYEEILNQKARPITQYERTPTKKSQEQGNKMDSLNKINHKIKGILNFMNENEKQFKREPKIETLMPKMDTLMDQSRKYSRDDILSYSNYTNMMDSKVVKTRNNAIQSKFQMPQTPKQKKLVTAFIKKNIEPANPNQLSFKLDSSSTILNKNLQKKEERNQYSTPGKNVYKKQSSYTPNKQYKLSNGKDLDEQIKKIQEKIQKSEDDKKRLNLKFEQMKNKKNHDPVSQFETRYNNRSVNERINEIRQANLSKSINERVGEIRETSGIKSIKKNINPKNYEQKSEKTVQPPFVYNQNKYEKQEFSDKKQIKNQIVNNNNRRNEYTPNKNPKSEFKIVPIPCQMDPEFKQQTKKLTKMIQDQVELDQKFRNSKIWFQTYGNNQKKWQELKEMLKNKNIYLNESEMKSEFQNTLQQHNPFYTPNDSKQSIEILVNKFIQTNNFWKNNLVNKFNRNELANENFKEEVMDLQRKGHLTVEDFVRFLNIETGTFYRNRDLILIFRRLTKQSNIKFDDFIDTITEKQY